MTWNMSRRSAYRDDAADRIQSFADDARSTAAEMRSRVSKAMGKGTKWASKKTGEVGATSRELAGSASDAVIGRPLLAIGIAVLAGFLVSQLFSRD